MTARDMNHLKYLDSVAAGDVAHLLEKEKTYQGSWKASGGRSAWFMMRRKIDRLLVMMAKPEPPEGFNLEEAVCGVQNMIDSAKTVSRRRTLAKFVEHMRDVYVSENIFAKIRESPSGADGTPLAEIRDLRRYLLLAEAEMMARGVVTVDVSGVVERSERMVPRYDTVVDEEPVARGGERPGTPENGGQHAGASYYCTYCGAKFESSETLFNHRREVHREGLKG